MFHMELRREAGKPFANTKIASRGGVFNQNRSSIIIRQHMLFIIFLCHPCNKTRMSGRLVPGRYNPSLRGRAWTPSRLGKDFHAVYIVAGIAFIPPATEIGRASVGKECRSRW